MIAACRSNAAGFNERSWDVLDAGASTVASGRLVVFDLERSAAEVQALWDLLSVDERERAARFSFDSGRTRYVVARARLRATLARELGMAARDLVFEYGVQGKPRFAPALAARGLKFNLSHSRTVGMIGMAWREIGVDVEVHRPLEREAEIAARYFSRREYADYLAVAPAERTTAFFNCWTRKEAFIKAIGHGLSYPLGSFDVALQPGERARILRVGETPGAQCGWSLAAFSPAPAIAAAVVLEGAAQIELRAAT